MTFDVGHRTSDIGQGVIHMCGIVGYIGERDSTPVLLEGLKRLEYRGYDSAGLAIVNGCSLKVVRRKGYLDELEKALDTNEFKGSLGIGHTRWATHGIPSERNAHPHLDCTGKIAVVHNGIIENFLSLKEELESKGHIFRSETDTEVLAHLIEDVYSGDLVSAVKETIGRLEGSFALAAVSSHHPDLIVAARKESPLVLGIGEGEYFLASDIPAVLKYTREVIILEDDDLVELRREGYKVTTVDSKPVERTILEIKWDAEAAEKSGYEDFMLKEIFEQPVAVRETIRGRISDDYKIHLDEINLSEDEMKGIDKIFVVACGTSHHAGIAGKYAIERWAKLPVEIEIASEFRYREPIVDPSTLVIAITQSGETADTLAGIRSARQRGGKIMAVTNVVGSSVTRVADGVLYTHAGPEIGVAATKTLVSQMTALSILALYIATARGSIDEDEARSIMSEINGLPDKVARILENVELIRDWSRKFCNCADFLFLGRGVGLSVALEGALKLKEISYIHAEGCAAGEMKHGPIALLDDTVPVVAVATKNCVYDKMLSNIQEVRARSAPVIAVATEGDEDIHSYAEHVYYVPETHELLSPILAVVPLQLLAYYMAKIRGCNVDQPRNLAKSVTVE